MTKYIITDKNINYDSSYTNIPYFANETDRDNYVESNLLTDWKNKLANRPELGKKINTNLSDTIQIQDSFDNIMNKNYMIIEKDSKYYFYFINSIGNVNNKTFILSITKDLIMTYPSIFDKVKNVKLTQSHLNNYYGYQMDGGYKEVINVSNYPFLNDDNEVYNQLKNKGWLIVFERVNDENDYLIKVKNGVIYKEPYKIYIAPLNPINTAEESEEEKVLYYQPAPNGYATSNQTSNNEIVISLNDNIDNNLSLNFRYRFSYTGSENFQSHTITLNDYNFVDNQEYIFLFNNAGSDNTATSISKTINTEGSYNNDLTLSDRNVYYIPLKISKQGTLLNISLIQMKDLITYIPNAKYYDSYYKNLPADELEKYGINDNTPDYLYFYKIYQIMANVWTSDDLFTYLETPTENSNIITAKTTNFIPVDTNQTEGLFSLLKTSNITYDNNNKIYKITSLNYDNLLNKNTYSFDVSDISKYDLIEGLNKYGLIIENLKEFSLNPNYITEDKTIEFQHYASFTPSWEERFKYINGNYISLTNSDNSFINNKEFIKGTDILASYKVNNPVTSKLEWVKPFFSVGNIAAASLGKSAGGWMKRNSITAADSRALLLDNATKFHYSNSADKFDLATDLVSKIDNGKSFNFKKLGSEIFRFAPIVGDIASVGLNRTNMKRQPDEFTGNGDINGDLIFNENGIKFSLIEYEFITPERDSIIETIKRYGVTTNIFITDLNDSKIRQPSFNFIVVSELDNSNNQELIDLLSNEEYREFADILASGVRIWWNIKKWKDFDSNE